MELVALSDCGLERWVFDSFEPAASHLVSSSMRNTHELFRRLLLDLKSDIRDFRADTTHRLAQVQDEIRKLNSRVSGKADEDILDASISPSADLEVPQYLRVRFEAAVQTAEPELQDDIKFPLVKGINAFHHHFEQACHGYLK